jgi:hypothetical protein
MERDYKPSVGAVMSYDAFLHYLNPIVFDEDIDELTDEELDDLSLFERMPPEVNP